MWECGNAIVGLIGIVERGELRNRKGSLRDRQGSIGLCFENQQLAILRDSYTQCAGFQEIWNCYIEGMKKGHRRYEVIRHGDSNYVRKYTINAILDTGWFRNLCVLLHFEITTILVRIKI